jgi:hypothetical protein
MLSTSKLLVIKSVLESQASWSSTPPTLSTITMSSFQTIAKIKNIHNKALAKPNHET